MTERLRARKNKHLTWNERLIIEKMLRKKYRVAEIADVIGCSQRTIYYELKRGTYEHTNSDLTTEIRYSPDIAQDKYEAAMTEKGRTALLALAPDLCRYIEYMIAVCRYSPEAILFEIRINELAFEVEIHSVNTIYRAIRNGLFPSLSLERLPRHGRYLDGRKSRVKAQKRAPAGTSIERRPEEVDSREEFGHWEADTVKGKATNKKAILTLTERKTLTSIQEVLRSDTTKEVVRAFNRLERYFGRWFYEIFKTVTVDNGSEFKDPEGMEKALYRKGKRTQVFYCHPRSPEERGSNENANSLVRRHFPKGSNFDKKGYLTRKTVKESQDWMNYYPRAKFGGRRSEELFAEELEKIGCPLRC